jgi:release factor glutamine methyltransferase
MSESWTSLALVRWTTDYFAQAQIPTPRLDAELLLAHAMGSDRLRVYLEFDRPLASATRERFRELVRLRARDRVPVAYLTGVREFWSHPFRVSADTLIPRPETELLVQAIVELAPRRLVDVGTGCGAVVAAAALELPELRALALDCSHAALRVARANVDALGLADRVHLLRCDGLSALRGPLELIASNPPYVPSGELPGLAPELRHEPRIALDGGSDGLELQRRLVREAPALLARPGHLLLEVGHGQARVLEAMLREVGASRVRILEDLAGVERVVAASFMEG